MDIEQILKENEELKQENSLLKEKLEKYMYQHKKYYESNKDVVIEKAKERLKKLTEVNPEKIKEYRRNAYLKRKDKLKNGEIKKN